MSTILKALKKLEREKEALRAAGPIPMISVPDTARGGPTRWFLKPWLLWGMAGVIIVVLCGTTWYFYRQSRVFKPQLAMRSDTMDHHPARRPDDAPQPAASQTRRDAFRTEPRRSDRSSLTDHHQPAGRQPAVLQTHSKPVGDHEHPGQPAESPAYRTSVPPPAQVLPAVGPSKPAKASAGHPVRAIQRPRPEKKPAAGPPAVLDEGEPVEAAPAAGSRDEAESGSNSQPPVDDYEKTPLLTDGRLRVHAIAWSPRTTERMAVINSRILHEGDSVEDFVIVVIRPDDVVVREKEKGVWRVEFGRP